MGSWPPPAYTMLVWIMKAELTDCISYIGIIKKMTGEMIQRGLGDGELIAEIPGKLSAGITGPLSSATQCLDTVAIFRSLDLDRPHTFPVIVII